MIIDAVPGDGGLISDYPCAAPCFYGVKPETTNFKDVEASFKENNSNLICKKWQNEGFSAISCGNFPFTTAVMVFDSDFDQDELVDYLDFSTEIDVTASDLIEKFGNPDFVYSSESGLIQLAYIDRGVTVRFYVDEDTEYLILQDTIVDRVFYNFRFGDESRWKEWNGYGSYPP